MGIAVVTGIVFAGVRWLLLRGTGATREKPLVRPIRRGGSEKVLTARSDNYKSGAIGLRSHNR